MTQPMNHPKTTTHPRFSVVIPAYNEEALLPQCLQSLAAQTFHDGVEVIVVDNNSSDATAAVARSHGARVVHEPHPGVCWARQAGTAQARGDIVVSTDADTVFAPDWLAKIDAAFRSNPRLVAVTGPCEFSAAPRWGQIYAALLFGTVAMIYKLTGRVIYATATNIAFQRTAWRGYDTNATQGGDELGLLRLLRSQGPLAFLKTNPTHTSARRMRRGLFYNLSVTFFYYYLFGYAMNRIAGRTVIGTYPHVRDLAAPPTTTQRLAALIVAAMWAVLTVSVATVTVRWVDA